MAIPQEPTIERQTKEAELDKNIWKILILGVLSVGASVASFYFFTKFLEGISLQNFVPWMFFTCLFFIITILEGFFVKSFKKLIVIAFVSALMPLTLFIPQLYPTPNVPILVGAGLFLFFLAYALYDGWKFSSEFLTIRFSFISRSVLSKVVTGLLILASAVTYVWYFDLGRFNPSDGYKLMSNSVFSIEPVLKIWFPGASLNQTVGDFFKTIAESQLRKIPVASSPNGNASGPQQVDFNILTKQQQQAAITNLGEALRVASEKSWNIPLPPTMRMQDILFSFVKEQVGHFSETTRSYFGLIVLLVFFSLFKGLFALFGWVVRFFAFLLYKLLIILGFVYVNVETRSREFVLLS